MSKIFKPERYWEQIFKADYIIKADNTILFLIPLTEIT